MKPQESDCSKMQKSNRIKLCLITSLGVVMLMVPIALAYSNVLELFTKFSLRMDNGTLLHGLVLRPLPSLKFQIYLFNVSNAQEFLQGKDEKVKLEEVGPFVYLEMRSNEDVRVNEEPGIMELTPNLSLLFVPEESIGYPNATYLTFPNVSLLSITALIGKFPSMMQTLYNVLATSTGAKAFQRINAHDILWGYDDPFVALGNKMVPGLVYFKTFGLFARLFDMEKYDYRLEVRTNDAEKFSLRKATRSKPKHPKKEYDDEAYIEKTQTFDNHTFEGAVFPPGLTPDFPIKIYRAGFCPTIDLQYLGTRPMYYGGDAFVYTVDINSTLNDRRQCDTKGWCPGGIMDASSCYFNFPVAISKGHFLDADPHLLDKVEGLKPERKLHHSEMVIDPKIGALVQVSTSVQVNLFLANMAYNSQCRRLHDTVLPLIRYQITSPPLVEEAQYALDFVYKQGPYILLAAQILFALCGLAMLTYSVRIWRYNQLCRKQQIDFNSSITHRPLLGIESHGGRLSSENVTGSMIGGYQRH